MIVALLAVAPALTPDAALGMGVCRAFGLLAARRRLTRRSQAKPAAAPGGRDALQTLDGFMMRSGDGGLKGQSRVKLDGVGAVRSMIHGTL